MQPIRQAQGKGTRHTIRLHGYDYTQSGWYFITICTENRESLFGDNVGAGEIVVGARRDSPKYIQSPAYMKLNPMGKIIENIWYTLPDHHSVVLDTFQIMPNHIHFIIQMVDVGASRRNDKGASRRAPTCIHPTLGWIVGMFKTECTKQINILNKTPGRKIFQRNFYEHIIRSERELLTIRQYIIDNPKNWERDRNNLRKQ